MNIIKINGRMSTIKMFDYKKSLVNHKDSVLQAISDVLDSGRLILGSQTESFEKEFARFNGVPNSLGVTSGTVALQLALMSLGVEPKDEVLTVSNTCTPTVTAIDTLGAIPVFVDIRQSDLLIDPELITQKITSKTKCIIVVHLYGQCADMSTILKIAEKHNIKVIEDCAQAFGSKYKGQLVGTLGDIGCFSFYPTKNLGAYGDAGAIISKDTTIFESLHRKRMYGYSKNYYATESGLNGRISEMQAAILRIKLREFRVQIEKRQRHALFYNKQIQNDHILLLAPTKDSFHSYHQYVLITKHREQFIKHLELHNINYGIHYPTPIHLMPYYHNLDTSDLNNTEYFANKIISIPVHESLIQSELEKVVSVINNFRP